MFRPMALSGQNPLLLRPESTARSAAKRGRYAALAAADARFDVEVAPAEVCERAAWADIPRALTILSRTGVGNPPVEGDELSPEG